MRAPMTFPAPASPVYLLADEADASALTDQLTARQAQLQALLAMTRGNAGDVFRRMGTEYQENYLWACAMIADEARELMDAIQARRSGIERCRKGGLLNSISSNCGRERTPGFTG